MRKSPDAFRTISEVAQELDLPQHVLRFWETRFSQIKPMKRGGGRRYYRPDDVELLRGIRHLLYGEGYTIKGVQRILKEQGVRHVIEAFPGHVPSPDDATAQGNPAEATQDIAVQGNAPSPQSQPQIEPQIEPRADYSSPAPRVSEQSTNPIPVESVEPAPSLAEPTPPQPAPVAPSVMQAEPAPQQPSPVAQPQLAAPAVTHAPPLQVEQPVAAQQAPEPMSAPAVSVPAPQPVPHVQPEMVQPNIPLQPPAGNGDQGANLTPPSASVLSVPPVPAPQSPATPVQAADLVQPAPDIPQGLNNSTAPASIMAPHVTQPAPMPQDLSQGEPVFRQGQEAAFSVEAGRNSLLQENKSGFFSRLRGKTATDEPNTPEPQAAPGGMPRDDVRRLQSTLFELLECKRILDQARNSS